MRKTGKKPSACGTRIYGNTKQNSASFCPEARALIFQGLPARASPENVLSIDERSCQPVLDCHGCYSVFLLGLLLISTSTAQDPSNPTHTLSAEQKETMTAFVLDGRYLLEAGKTGESDLI